MAFCKHRVMDNCKKDNRPCIFSKECCEPEEKKMTNADRIRNMTDEELANSNIYFVSEFVAKDGLRYTGLDGHYYKTGKEVYEANMEWLQAEVKEGAE